MTKQERFDAAESFDEWWAKNEEQYMADALHMSAYHMASMVWGAAKSCQTEEYAEFVKDGACP